jgi:hypothetical protein
MTGQATFSVEDDLAGPPTGSPDFCHPSYRQAVAVEADSLEAASGESVDGLSLVDAPFEVEPFLPSVR